MDNVLAKANMVHIPSIQSLLRKYDIRPKKRLGQNFLIAQPTMLKIVDTLGLKRDDTVLEIGCGLGVMTAMIAERCRRVIAVDADAGALEIARSEFNDVPHIEWLHEDILKLDIGAYARSEKLLVVGNIPYNISSPILFRLVDFRAYIRRAVVMVQKEVAERIAARPGGKEYGALSVMLQSYAACVKLFNVSRTNFAPRPNVTSAVIGLDFTTQDAPPLESLRPVVQAAFQKRRKTLRNALLGSQLKVDAADLDRMLDRLGIDPRRRPETLSVDEFRRLAAACATK